VYIQPEQWVRHFYPAVLVDSSSITTFFSALFPFFLPSPYPLPILFLWVFCAGIITACVSSQEFRWGGRCFAAGRSLCQSWKKASFLSIISSSSSLPWIMVELVWHMHVTSVLSFSMTHRWSRFWLWSKVADGAVGWDMQGVLGRAISSRGRERWAARGLILTARSSRAACIALSENGKHLCTAEICSQNLMAGKCNEGFNSFMGLLYIFLLHHLSHILDHVSGVVTCSRHMFRDIFSFSNTTTVNCCWRGILPYFIIN